MGCFSIHTNPIHSRFRLLSLLMGVGIAIWSACAGSPYAAYNRGVQFYKEGLTDAAEIAFLEAVQQDPKNDESWNQLGMIAFERNDLDAAEKRFRKACDLHRLRPAYPRNLAMVYAQKKQYDLALKLIQKSLDIDPTDPETYLAQAKVQWLIDRKNAAAQSLARVLELDPANQEAIEMLSHLQPSAN